MLKSKRETRERRKMHIRKKLSGTTERPRVFVFRSNRYVYMGVADDQQNKVLASVMGGKNKDEAIKLAKKFGEILKKKKIEAVVFDRSGYQYNGVIKNLADTLRESGINL